MPLSSNSVLPSSTVTPQAKPTLIERSTLTATVTGQSDPLVGTGLSNEATKTPLPTSTPSPTATPQPTLAATKSPTPVLDPDDPCPVTPTQSDFWPEQIGDAMVAGEFPVWTTIAGQKGFSVVPPQGGPTILPPLSGDIQFPKGVGVITKAFLFVDDDVEGDLRVTIRQLDGDGMVYFPEDRHVSRITDTKLRIRGLPPDVLIIRSAHERTRSPNPPGIAHHGMTLIYPGPGCYQFTATIAGYTVNIVFKLVDMDA